MWCKSQRRSSQLITHQKCIRRDAACLIKLAFFPLLAYPLLYYPGLERHKNFQQLSLKHSKQAQYFPLMTEMKSSHIMQWQTSQSQENLKFWPKFLVSCPRICKSCLDFCPSFMDLPHQDLDQTCHAFQTGLWFKTISSFIEFHKIVSIETISKQFNMIPKKSPGIFLLACSLWFTNKQASKLWWNWACKPLLMGWSKHSSSSQQSLSHPGQLTRWPYFLDFGCVRRGRFLWISRNLSKVAVRRAQNKKFCNISRIFQE